MLSAIASQDSRSEREISAEVVESHLIEIISDSGEGAQKCGQSFATIAAKSGNGVWTSEIIPAEIQPPARSTAGASGNRVRFGSTAIRNGGDYTDLVIAFNEQVLIGRLDAGELKPGCKILLENCWSSASDEAITSSYRRVLERLRTEGYVVYEVPMADECRKLEGDSQRGKNMFALGMLLWIYGLEPALGRAQIEHAFHGKSANAIERNLALFAAGYAWAARHLDFKYHVPPADIRGRQVVMNGNTALALGIVASGMQVCAMYPITPATSTSHYLAEIFERAGGLVHQAEDEIAACGFAIGSSYAGTCAVTITSGPGLSLKQELIGLAVMGEIPLVVVDVQRGGPSTGQPTKVEQGDLLAACFGSHGDAPKVVMAVSDVADCFSAMITARKIAETFNMVVIVLSDAKLATAQQLIPRPAFQPEWVAPPLDLAPVPEGTLPYDWDAHTGLAQRIQPGRSGGMFTLTGLAHDRSSRVAYDPATNQEGLTHRSLKLAALARTLRPPSLFGDPEGDLLAIGWGSTQGEIEEAVERLRARGQRVSSLHLRFLQPLAPGMGDILRRFRRVMTIEMSYCDDPSHPLIGPDNRRYSALAQLLRARFLIDVDCWSEVTGQPIKPARVERALERKLAEVTP
jgi:2-oxoglutarate/2-oxoacid ferredoxin oxidoreductase subunit alpha